jgi:hypothetical protein
MCKTEGGLLFREPSRIFWVVYVLPSSIVASLLALDDRNIFTICQWFFSILGEKAALSDRHHLYFIKEYFILCKEKVLVLHTTVHHEK